MAGFNPLIQVFDFNVVEETTKEIDFEEIGFNPLIQVFDFNLHDGTQAFKGFTLF